MMMQASLLDDQERVLEEVIRASARIVEQQVLMFGRDGVIRIWDCVYVIRASARIIEQQVRVIFEFITHPQDLR